MSRKKIIRQKAPSVAQRKLHPRLVAAIAVMLSLLASVGVLARRGYFATHSVAPTAQEMPANLSSPSKEYIYAGGRLVATEEPASLETIGLYDPTTSTFFLRNSNSTGVADLTFGYGPAGAGWIPVAGDWNGDGTDTIGLYNPATSTFFLSNSNSSAPADLVFAYGPAGAGWIPLAGDWNGDRTNTIGLFNPTTSTFFLSNSNPRLRQT